MVRPTLTGAELDLNSKPIIPREAIDTWQQRLTTATVLSQIAAQQTRSNAEPAAVHDFAKNNLAGFAWAGARNIGGFEVVVAAVTPRRQGARDILHRDHFESALGNLPSRAALAIAPDSASSAFLLNARAIGSGDVSLTIRLQPSSGRTGFEIATSAGAFLGAVPGQRNEIFNFDTARLNAGADGALNNPGILVRIPGLEGVLNDLSQRLLTYLAARTADRPVAGYANRLANDFLRSLATIGGTASEGWQTYAGPVWRASVKIDPVRVADSTLSFQGRTVSLGDLSHTLNAFANNASNSTLAEMISSVNLQTRPRSTDDLFMTLRTDARGNPVDNAGHLSQKVSETLNQGADALSLLSTAWKVWENRNNNQTLRDNAAAIFNSSDPRMQVAQALALAFYTVSRDTAGTRKRQTVNLAGANAAEREALFSAEGLNARKELAFADFQINRISPILNALYTRLVSAGNAQASQNEINARIQAFAEQLIRLGVNVNLGSSSIEAALTAANRQSPQDAPSLDNRNSINAYFARSDLKQLTSAFAQAADPAEKPMAQSDVKRVYLYAGEESATAWQKILNEAASGRVDLFEALAAVKESGGADHPTTIAIDGMRGDLTALLTAPVTDLERLAELYDLPSPTDFDGLIQQRAEILAGYQRNPTFENMVAALHARVRIEPLFGITLQDYFLTRNVNLPLDLFRPVSPDDDANELFDTDEFLPAPASQTLTSDQGDCVASCIVRKTVPPAAPAEASETETALLQRKEANAEEVAFPPAAWAAGLDYAYAPLSGGSAWFHSRHKRFPDRVPLKHRPVILLCWEGGSGSGHAACIRQIAAALNGRGARCIVSAFDRQSLEDLAQDAENAVLAPQDRFGGEQAPFFAPARHSHDNINFTKYLWRLGFWRIATIAANLKAWDKIITRVQPDVVMAYLAPFALLTAAGRVPTLTIGHGLYVPAAADGYLTLDGKTPSLSDRTVQAGLFANVEQAFALAGGVAPASIAQALCGDTQCPATLPALDPRHVLRSNALSPPVMAAMPAISRGHGREAFIDMGESPADHIGVISAVAKACSKTVLYAKRGSNILSTGSLPANVQIQREPFSAEEIARRAALVVHHGGVDMTHMAALAGVPQLIAYHGGEGWHHASAVSRLNAGAGQPLDGPKAKDLEGLAFTVSSAVLYRAAAQGWAEDSHKWMAGRRGADVISEKALLAIA